MRPVGREVDDLTLMHAEHRINGDFQQHHHVRERAESTIRQQQVSGSKRSAQKNSKATVTNLLIFDAKSAKMSQW